MTAATHPENRSGCLATALARTVRLLTRPRPIFTAFTRLHARVLRLSGGWIRRSVLLAGGQPVLSLSTIGRRSGQSRSTVVAYMRDGGAYVVTAVTLGSERDPAWFLNLDADPRGEIDVEGSRIAVVARRAKGSERQHLWDLWLERLPATEAFSEIAGREIPVLVLEPVA